MILFEIVTYFYQKAEKWDNYALFLDKKSAKCEDWPPQAKCERCPPRKMWPQSAKT